MARYVAGEIMNDGFVNLSKHKRSSGGFPMFTQVFSIAPITSNRYNFRW